MEEIEFKQIELETLSEIDHDSTIGPDTRVMKNTDNNDYSEC